MSAHAEQKATAAGGRALPDHNASARPAPGVRLGLFAAALAAGAAMQLPLGGSPPVALASMPVAFAVVAVSTALLLWTSLRPRRPSGLALVPGLAASLGLAGASLAALDLPGVAGAAGSGFWSLAFAAWAGASLMVSALAAERPRSVAQARFITIAVPVLFGVFLFYLWEICVRAFAVPAVLMPAPSAISQRIVGDLPMLGADFVQTFLKGVLSGYVIGNIAGFVVAVAADRVPFLRRGLLPLGQFVSALPIIGIAPIMVMWFGFDWPSKAAVVVVMTFFPMLVNAVAGLASAGPLERDLMRSYGATWGQTLLKLRLPAAMPFLFNALKINSTLALIGAIVAEFFGTPIVGIGFRISIEAGRMALDMVWAEIALAAVSGTLFYGLVSLIERRVTFWHASYRK